MNPKDSQVFSKEQLKELVDFLKANFATIPEVKETNQLLLDIIKEKISTVNKSIDSNKTILDVLEEKINNLTQDLDSNSSNLLNKLQEDYDNLKSIISNAISKQEQLSQDKNSLTEEELKNIRLSIDEKVRMMTSSIETLISKIPDEASIVDRTYQKLRPYIPEEESASSIRSKFDETLGKTPISAKDIANLEEFIDGSKIKNIPRIMDRVVIESGGRGFIETSIKDSTGRLLSKDASGAWIVPASTGGSGIPALPYTSIQFNNSGSFGGDVDMNWDNTYKTVQLGTLTSNLSRLLSYGRTLPAPTGATAVISGYDSFVCSGSPSSCDSYGDQTSCEYNGCNWNNYDCGDIGDEGTCNSTQGCSWNGDTSFCDGGVQQFCNGSPSGCDTHSMGSCETYGGCSVVNPDTYASSGISHQYKIFAYRVVGGVRYYSAINTSNSVTDNNTANFGYNVSISWSAPSGYTPDGYRIYKSTNGGAYNEYIETTSPFVDGDSFTSGAIETPDTYLSGDFETGGLYTNPRHIIESSNTSTDFTDPSSSQLVISNTDGTTGVSSLNFVFGGTSKTYIASNKDGILFTPNITATTGYFGGAYGVTGSGLGALESANNLVLGNDIIQTVGANLDMQISGTTTTRYLQILTDADGVKLRGFGSSTNLLKLGGDSGDVLQLTSNQVAVGGTPYLVRNNTQAQYEVIGASYNIAIGDGAMPSKPDDSSRSGINLNASASTSSYGAGIAYNGTTVKTVFGMNSSSLDNHVSGSKGVAVIISSSASSPLFQIEIENSAGGSYSTPWAIGQDNTQGIGFGALTSYSATLALKSISNSVTTFYVRGFDSGTTALLANFDGQVTGLTNGQNLIIDKLGNLRMGSTSNALARLHLSAGNTAFAPVLFVTGSLLTTPLAGAMEYNTPDLFFTPGSATRYNIPQVSGAGVQGDLLYASGASIYSRLAKDTNSTRYLSNTGTSNNPAWSQIDLTNGVTGALPVANGGTGSTIQFNDNIALTNQTADVASTNFTHGNVAGTYRVNYTLLTTSTDITAGAVSVTFAWTDGAGSTTMASASLILTALGRTQGVFYLQLASGNIAYSTSHTGIFGTSKYALYMALERIS